MTCGTSCAKAASQSLRLARDKFGVSWQIIPNSLGKMLGDKDPEKSKRVMQGDAPDGEIDVAKLKEAYEQ